MRVDLDVVLVNPKPHVTSFRPSEFMHTTENVVIVHIQGPLIQGAAVSFFLEQIRILIRRGISNFVIDLLEATSIDSRGIGGLAATYNAVRDARGKVRYVFSSNELFSAVRENHLDSVLEIHQDEASALASF